MISMPSLVNAEKIGWVDRADARVSDVYERYSPAYGFKLDENRRITPVSGYAGTSHQMTTAHPSASKSMTWWESRDKPVKIVTQHSP